MSQAPFGIRQAEVREVRATGGYGLLTVRDLDGPIPEPGQFYMLATAERWSGGGERPYLPRAISVAEVVPRPIRCIVDGSATSAIAAATSGR